MKKGIRFALTLTEVLARARASIASARVRDIETVARLKPLTEAIAQAHASGPITSDGAADIENVASELMYGHLATLIQGTVKAYIDEKAAPETETKDVFEDIPKGIKREIAELHDSDFVNPANLHRLRAELNEFDGH